jgi:streptogramin lyase
MGLVVAVVATHVAVSLPPWDAGPVLAQSDPPQIELSTTITAPDSGDTVDDGVVIEAEAVAGVAAGGERALVVVLDLSGSVNSSAGGDCDGNGTIDTILTCEIEAAIEVFDRAIAVGSVREVGVAVFAGSGTAADVSPATGFQYLTEPDADLNGNALRDLDEVVRSVFVNGGVGQFTRRTAGAGTNYAAGIAAACSVAAQASTSNPLVVFLSDGDNLLGGNVSGQLPCTTPSEFQTFAVGTGASCTRDPSGRGSLQDIAELTGGACTNVVSPADLPRILSETITPDITSVTARVNGGSPIDISPFVAPPLPAPAATVSWPAVGLSPGPNEVCITSAVELAGQVVTATDCVELFVRGGLTADAGPDQQVAEGSVVTLDASRSTGSGLRTTTWTTTEEYRTGSSVNVDDAGDRLALDDEQQASEFIWIAASARGTVVKVDTRTGEILGEYRSAPQNRLGDPSRTTVDRSGSVWVGNRAESGSVAGAPRGSVTKIGLAENGQCEDRNGDGVIQTSSGLGDIRAWPNAAGQDTAGGVSTAQDECIVEYVRTNGVNIRHVSVDADNHVWVGGPYGGGAPRFLDRVSPTGEIVRSIDLRNPAHTGEASAIECCYGGLVDPQGILWTSTANWNRLVRIDPSLPNGHPDLVRVIPLSRTSYGLGIDPDGNLWQTNWTYGTVQKLAPDGTIVGTWSTSGGGGDRGVAATDDGDVWVANSSGASVSRLTGDGTLVAVVPVGVQPTGIAVDAAGKVWATNLTSNTASRIDPATNSVDLTVDLGAGAGPYNYSDMTGSTLTGAPPPERGASCTTPANPERAGLWSTGPPRWWATGRSRCSSPPPTTASPSGPTWPSRTGCACPGSPGATHA